MKAKASGSIEITPAPVGTHMARVASLLDMGTQDTKWGDKRQVRVSFELLGQNKEIEIDGEKKTIPFYVSKTSTLSMNERAFLRQVTDCTLNTGTLKPEEAEMVAVEEILGKALLVTVEHYEGSDGNTYAGIKNISSLPTGSGEPAEMEGDKMYFSFDDSSQEDFDKLPEWLQNKLKETPEYKVFGAVGSVENAGEDDGITPADIPF